MVWVLQAFHLMVHILIHPGMIPGPLLWWKTPATWAILRPAWLPLNCSHNVVSLARSGQESCTPRQQGYTQRTGGWIPVWNLESKVFFHVVNHLHLYPSLFQWGVTIHGPSYEVSCSQSFVPRAVFRIVTEPRTASKSSVLVVIFPGMVFCISVRFFVIIPIAPTITGTT